MKTILYAVRSDGDAERLSAYCYFYIQKYKQINIIDDSLERISNTQITKIFKKYSKVLYLRDFLTNIIKKVLDASL